MSRREFWALTIRELFQEFAIAKRTARRDANDRVFAAWLAEYFARQKKLVAPQTSPFWQRAGQARAGLTREQKKANVRAMFFKLADTYGLKVQTEG